MSEATTTPVADAPATEAPAAEGIGNILADAAPETPVVEAPAEPVKAEPVATEYKDIKVPEGIAADDPALTEFAAQAAKMGISQENAEALLAQVGPKIAEQLAQPYKVWNDTQAAWQGEIKADATFGGDKLAPTTQAIARLLDNPAFCDPKLREALVFTGAGNNPAVFRTFAKIAAILTEGQHVSGSPAVQTNTLSSWYPSMTPEASQSGA